jgi:HlyD family secretion protein
MTGATTTPKTAAAPHQPAPALVNVNFRRPVRFGLAMFCLLVFGIFGWMAFAPLSGATIATGSVVVKAKPQLVQHLDGGIVKAILVRNGDVVRKGDTLARLDETTLLANLEIYRNRIREAVARKSRLEGERDDRAEIVFDDRLLDTMKIAPEASHREGQVRLFVARRSTRLGQADQLKEKIAQFNSQIGGIQGLIVSKTTQLTLVNKELDAIKFLFTQGVVTQARLIAQERAKADVAGQLSEHSAELGRVQNSIREAEVSIGQVDRQFKESILTDLREVSNQLDDLVQQISATTRQIDRIEVKAPVNGIVHELMVNTIGGTIPPNSTLMQIISTDEGLDVEVSVETQAIDQVSVGAEAALRFSALNQRTTPEILGKVDRISPTSVVDEKTGMAFYRVGITASLEEFARLGSARLIPGMPVEAFIHTEARTTFSYLLKPLSDNFARTMRER